MSFIECVLEAQQDGKITKRSADFIQKKFTGENIEEVVGELRANIKRDKFLTALQAVKQNQAGELIAKQKDKARGIMSLITKDISQAAGHSNIEYRSRAIQGIFDSKFGEALEAMRTKWFGLSNTKELQDKVVRALYGDTTDTDASKFAKMWSDVAEEARVWFNHVGGDIGKLHNWRLPQAHNAMKVKEAGFEQWYKDIAPKLDFDDMPDLDNPEAVFKDMWETITTNGLNKLEPGKLPKGISSNLAKSHNEERFLKFKDAEGYLEYQDKYGNPDILSTMTDHLKGMSHDIAMLEVLGPNPSKTFEYLKDVARKEGMGANREAFLDAAFNVASGKVDTSSIVSKTDFALAATAGGFRALNTAAKLGSAVLSSIADLSTGLLTAGFNHMSYISILGRQLNTLLQEITTTGSAENIRLGVRMGLVADAWNSTLANSRYAEHSTGKIQQIAETTLRLSGMNAYTEAGRKAFGMEFMANIAEDFNKGLKDIKLKETFERYGFTEAEWDKIRSSKPLDQDGAVFFDVQDMMVKDRDLALKVMEMVHTETDYAVLVPDARVRAITTGGEQRGTIKGEIARTVTQFKSFPIAMLTTHLGRLAGLSKADGLQYGAKLFVMTTVMGSLALELKDLAAGKTSRLQGAIDNDIWGKHLMASILQGGGLGIFGDFFFQDQSRFGNSPVVTLSGPLGSLVEDVYSLTAGNIHKEAEGKDVHWGSDVVDFGKKYLPGQNLWYTRLLFDRMVFDTVKEMVDPKYNQKVRQQAKRMRKETGQEWRIER